MPVDPPDKSLFLAPRSVVFIGVSRKTGSGSLNPVDNLRSWGYKGEIHVVHPQVPHVGDVRTVPNVASLKSPVDLGIIATPRETIPGIVRRLHGKRHQSPDRNEPGFC